MIPQTADIAVDHVIDIYDKDGKLIESDRSVRTNSMHVIWEPWLVNALFCWDSSKCILQPRSDINIMCLTAAEE